MVPHSISAESHLQTKRGDGSGCVLTREREERGGSLPLVSQTTSKSMASLTPRPNEQLLLSDADDGNCVNRESSSFLSSTRAQIWIDLTYLDDFFQLVFISSCECPAISHFRFHVPARSPPP